MTPVLAVLVPVAVAAAVVWVGGRLAAAEARRVELEAFRVSLGLPADRFGVVDVGLIEGWRTRRSIRPFRTVHQVDRPAAPSAREVVVRR